MPFSVPLRTRWEALRLLVAAKVGAPRRIRKQLRRMARRNTPVLAGPWLSEVGFELLYWIPFLRRVLPSYGIVPERVVAISRGGASAWYEGVADRYCETFSLFSPQQFLEENQAREAKEGIKKQFSAGTFDRRIMAACASRLRLERYNVVHPSLMYNLFSGFWRGWMHPTSVRRWSDHRRLSLSLTRPPQLPFADYAAAKFYFSDCFPDTPANRAFVRNLLGALAQRVPVVLLNTGLRVDDHRDAGLLRSANLFDATPLMEPHDNLAVQTALVANARFLVSTYGGFSYLGPLLGKPTYSFYSTPNFVGCHLQLAHEVFNQDADAFLAVLPTAAVERLLPVLGESHALVHRQSA